VLSALIAADADMVWTTVSPSVLAGLVGGANAEGYLPMWSGNVPSFSYLLLGSAVGPLLDTNYIVSNYIVTWNTEGVAGLDEMKDWMGKHNPELPISDSYIIGWTEAMAAHQVLERAAADGDLTRAGVIAAFNKVTVDYKGLAPNQSWGGDANDNVIRETYFVRRGPRRLRRRRDDRRRWRHGHGPAAWTMGIGHHQGPGVRRGLLQVGKLR